jgi:hypothetical protein
VKWTTQPRRFATFTTRHWHIDWFRPQPLVDILALSSYYLPPSPSPPSLPSFSSSFHLLSPGTLHRNPALSPLNHTHPIQASTMSNANGTFIPTPPRSPQRDPYSVDRRNTTPARSSTYAPSLSPTLASEGATLPPPSKGKPPAHPNRRNLPPSPTSFFKNHGPAGPDSPSRQKTRIQCPGDSRGNNRGRELWVMRLADSRGVCSSPPQGPRRGLRPLQAAGVARGVREGASPKHIRRDCCTQGLEKHHCSGDETRTPKPRDRGQDTKLRVSGGVVRLTIR